MPASRFIGEVRTEWLTEPGPDRWMILINDFAFVDPNGKRWNALTGRKINGASIPRILWSLAGSPYTGDYRRASVLHDVACQDQTEPSKAVHRMFYDAMVCDGVSEAEAVEFYAAVRLFGPSWSTAEFAADGRMVTRPRPRKPARTIAEVETALDAVLGE
jgi:hypothetical protein